MTNIVITHELCAEDRARLDRLTEALERRTCDSCVASALTYAENVRKETSDAPKEIDLDAVQQKLAETMARASAPAEAPKNAPEEAKAETATTDHPADKELPWAAETAEEKAEPTVTLEQIQQKVTQLAAANNGAKKAEVREIVNAYAKKVSELPADKWTEVWSKLCALESED